MPSHSFWRKKKKRKEKERKGAMVKLSDTEDVYEKFKKNEDRRKDRKLQRLRIGICSIFHCFKTLACAL